MFHLVFDTKQCERHGQAWNSVFAKRTMGRPARIIPRTVVDDCEIVKVTDTSVCAKLQLAFGQVPTRGRGRRFCLLCPGCGRRAFKLYRPPDSPLFQGVRPQPLGLTGSLYLVEMCHRERLSAANRLPGDAQFKRIPLTEEQPWRIFWAMQRFLRKHAHEQLEREKAGRGVADDSVLVERLWHLYPANKLRGKHFLAAGMVLILTALGVLALAQQHA